MKILTVGGGSGGHVTPIVSVLREIRNLHPNAQIRFWCDRHFAREAGALIDEYDPSIRKQKIWAGKLRRYQHLSKLQHILIPSIFFPNIRDIFLVFLGAVQSFVRLIIWRPDIVFLKGGYVCLPVGIAAAILRIPFVIHDSDAHPGLTNRLLAPFANRIATGMPLEYYDYPKKKSFYAGIPIDPSFQVLSDKRRLEVKRELGLGDGPLVVFIGGGQGARKINDAVARNLSALLDITNVMLISGSEQFDELRSLTPQNDPRFILKDFISSGMADILGSADIVVSRAGATALLELAATARPTILVPSKRLVWQVKHAQHYLDSGSALLLDEDDFEKPGNRSLVELIDQVLGNKSLQDKLSTNLHKGARPQAARLVAEEIMKSARRSK